MEQFLHDNDNDTKAIAIPRVFLENGLAKNAGDHHFLLYSKCFQKAFFLRVAI